MLALAHSAAMLGVDVAALQVKINEGALYPVLAVQGNVTQQYDFSQTIKQQFSASVLGQVTIPIYQGGKEYSTIRQSK